MGGPHRGLQPELGARVAAVLLLLFFCWNATCTAASAQVPSHGEDPMQGERPPCANSAEAVSHVAQQVCGGAPVETALRSIGLQEAEA